MGHGRADKQALCWHGTSRRHLQETDQPNQAFLLFWNEGSIPLFIFLSCERKKYHKVLLIYFEEAVMPKKSTWRPVSTSSFFQVLYLDLNHFHIKLFLWKPFPGRQADSWAIKVFIYREIALDENLFFHEKIRIRLKAFPEISALLLLSTFVKKTL